MVNLRRELQRLESLEASKQEENKNGAEIETITWIVTTWYSVPFFQEALAPETATYTAVEMLSRLGQEHFINPFQTVHVKWDIDARFTVWLFYLPKKKTLRTTVADNIDEKLYESVEIPVMFARS